MKTTRHTAAFVLVILAVMTAQFTPAALTNLPFWNPDLPMTNRVEDLIARLTLQEKVSQVMMECAAIPRLEIPKYHWWNECVHGVARAGRATQFPQGIAMAATWNTGLIQAVPAAISDEARAKFVYGQDTEMYHGLTFWSPVINMARDPRWGRTEECYGEDPCLAGRIATAFINGLQGNDPDYLKTAATPKHFAANNDETSRLYASPYISDRALREYYFPAFKTSLTDAKAESIMCAYNGINGVPIGASPWLLTGIIRDEWGFKGTLVTDVGVSYFMQVGHHYTTSEVQSVSLAMNAGCDILSEWTYYSDYVYDAAVHDRISETRIDEALRRSLATRFRLGLFDPTNRVAYTQISTNVIGSAEHIALARECSRESIVLLKNGKPGGETLLPLDRDSLSSIAVLGPYADVVQLGGYSGTSGGTPVTPLEGIQNHTSSNTIVRYSMCSLLYGDSAYPIAKINLKPPTPAEGEQGLRGEYYPNKTFSGTPFTRTDLTVDFDWQDGSPDPYIPADNFSVRWSGTLLPATTGVHQVFVTVDDGVRLYIDGRLLIDQWKEQAPTEYSVSLALTNGYLHQIVMEYFEQAGGAVAKLYWREPGVSAASVLAREKNAAAASDSVVAVIGLSPAYEGENLDRSTINLPADQLAWLQELYAVNSNIIVVLENGGPLAVNWIEASVPAVLAFWYHGEQGGNALADVLFGIYNPAGRLPMTWYASDGQLPPLSDYEIKQGRTYMYLDTPPLYPFGYGLSYTTFEYENLQLSTNKAGVDDTVNISFDVRNAGNRAGDEVVQLYVRDGESSVYQPLKQLKDFTKIHLETNELKQVSFSLPVRNLSFWAPETNMFVVESGLFDVLIGASSEDIRLSNVVSVSSWYTNTMTNVVATVTKIQFDMGTVGGIYAGAESPGHSDGFFSSTDTNWNGMGATLDVSGGLVGADGVHDPGLTFQATAVPNNTVFTWSPCEKIWVNTVAPGAGIYDTALMEDRYEVDRGGHDLGVRVKGLPPRQYRVWAIVRLNDQTDKEFTFSIGTNRTTMTPPYLVTTSSAGVEQWTDGKNYVTDTVMIDSVDDWITVLCVRNDSYKGGSLSGLQIAAIPEPAVILPILLILVAKLRLKNKK